MSIFISATELKAFIGEILPKQNPPMTWEIETEGALDPVGPAAYTVESLEGLKKVLKEDEEAARRAKAAYAISTIPAKDARSAIPNLLDAIKDESGDVSRSAQAALQKIGAAGDIELPILVQNYLADSNVTVKLYTIRAIAKMGPAGASACDALMELTKDGTDDVRRECVLAVGKVGGGQRDKVFPLLFAQLKDAKDKQLRALLIDGLNSLGKPSSGDVDLLKESLANSNSDVRVYCAKALGQVGADAKSAVPALKACLKNEDLATAVASAEALGKIGTEAKDAKAALLDAMQDTHAALSTAAADALIQIKIDKTDVPALATSVKTGQTHVKISALKMLGALGEKEALDPIATALKDPEKAVKIQAIKSLEGFAPGMPQAAGKLFDPAKDPDAEIRIAAIRALGKFGPAAGKDAVKILDDFIAKDAIKDKNVDVGMVKEVVATLAAMKPEGNSGSYVAGHIVDLLEEEKYSSMATEVGNALGSIGAPAARPMGGAVARMLTSKHADRRQHGAIALGQMAPELKKDIQLRLYLAKALETLIPKEQDPEAKKALQEAHDKLTGGV
jgi:HEAT repeat protein